MLYLAFIFHMHQPYYKNLLTNEIDLPWVRLHGTKDYLDMVEILSKYPAIRQTFNLVPSLIEQIEDYIQRTVKDKYLELSYKSPKELTLQEKAFIQKNFFSISKEQVIFQFPRYAELYFKKLNQKEFTDQDYLDLQLWFNLAWIDPNFRNSTAELKQLINKARFFSQEEKQLVLEKQLTILEEIIPTYKKFMATQQIEITTSPYYHPILPLIYNTKIAKESDLKAILPKNNFSFPEDVRNQIEQAKESYQTYFGSYPEGLWPSEEAVSEQILPFVIQAGINWIIADEAILFKSLKRKKRDAHLLYQPHLLRRREGNLEIIFRDRNLSDLIGFTYYCWSAKDAVSNFIKHLEDIASSFGNHDILVTVALDGENAWEYYPNDGHDFLELLYAKLSEATFLETTTVSEYLKNHPPHNNIEHLAAGSWIYANFNKWMGNPYKLKAWEYLAQARAELARINESTNQRINDLAWKQLYICEGSDWFWWYGENHADFDRLFRMHLSNFYRIIDRQVPEYLKQPL